MNSFCQVSCGNIGRKVIRRKGEESDPSCYKRLVFKAKLCDGVECRLPVNGIGNSHFLQRHNKVLTILLFWRESTSIRALFFDSSQYIFPARPHTVKITTNIDAYEMHPYFRMAISS